MKSIHYIASTVAFYRQVLDGKIFTKEEGLDLLSRVPNRGYTDGFMSGSVTSEDYQYDQSRSSTEYRFVGNITDRVVDGRAVLEIRNKIKSGETLELLTPDGEIGIFTMPAPLITDRGAEVDEVNNSQFVLLTESLVPYSILRRADQGNTK